VRIGVIQPLSCQRYCHVDLCPGHAERGEGTTPNDGQDLAHSFLLVQSDEAQGPVAGPDTNGYLLDDALDVLESGGLEHGAQILRKRDVHAELGEGLGGFVVKVLDGVVGRHGSVIAERSAAELLQFDPATGLETPAGGAVSKSKENAGDMRAAMRSATAGREGIRTHKPALTPWVHLLVQQS